MGAAAQLGYFAFPVSPSMMVSSKPSIHWIHHCKGEAWSPESLLPSPLVLQLQWDPA